MKRLMLFLKSAYPILILIILEILLFATNYNSGTFLVGWDNLYPELNFSANFKRNLFAIWQEYRGLGLYDGMAHAANLPHTFFLWLFHFFLPQNLLRYFFVFLMHFLGGVGIFILLERKILKGQPFRRIVSLLGSFFYLFNLATIQMFYAPLEVFCFHFAFLPWLIFALLRYLEKPGTKNLLLFFLLSVFSLPQGFIPQIFLVYLILVFSILFFHLWQRGRQAFGQVASCLLIIFSINAYWVLPYAFSIPNNSQTIMEAKINQMSSEDIYLKNKFRGNFGDVVFLKGFMLDVTEFTSEDESPYIMQVWREHLETLNFRLPALIFFSFCLLGLLHTFVKKKVYLFPFGFCLLLSFFFLGNNIWGVKLLNSFVRENLPLFAEAFRFPFTKFSLLFAFSYTIFLTLGISFLICLVKKYWKRNVLVVALLLPVFVLIGSSAHLSYQGNFLFPSLRLKIADEYLKTIAFFKEQERTTRIATFPQPNFWNWRFHTDGYRGSGFLWYGIEQPILDRAFDPWSRENENYYWEISYALYSQNQELFEDILEKYQINWLLVDRNIISPNTPQALYFEELEQMAETSEKISLAQEFRKIKIYQVALQTPVKNFIFLGQNLPVVEPSYQWNDFDKAFSDNNHYFSTPQLSTLYLNSQLSYFPFRSLFTGRSQNDLEFKIEEKGEFFILEKNLPWEFKNYRLEGSQEKEELLFVNPEDLSQVQILSPEVYFDGQTIRVIIPKIKGYFSAEIKPATAVLETENCHEGQGEVQNKILEEDGQSLLRLEAIETNNCSAAFWLPNLPHHLSYLITVESRNIQGKPLLFWLENLTIRKPDIETYVGKAESLTTSYFIQPLMQNDGLGYTLHFDNISIGQEKTVNDLSKINVNLLPYRFLTSLVLVSPEAKPTLLFEETPKVFHPHPSFYLINVKPQEPIPAKTTLVLSQAFDKGFIAYRQTNSLSRIFPFFGQRLTSHVLVNNWANGFLLEEESRQPIIIIFWPQYLEYLGFGFFFLVIAFLLARGFKNYEL